MCKGGSVVLRVSADVVGSVHVSASSIAGDSWRVARKGRSVGCLVAVGEVEEAVAEDRGLGSEGEGKGVAAGLHHHPSVRMLLRQPVHSSASTSISSSSASASSISTS